jgi:hypothetical protein
MDDIDEVLAKWIERVNLKTSQINNAADQAVLKAALFCEGEAKKNAMTMIYNVPIDSSYERAHFIRGKAGHYKTYYKRTGLYKASIGSGLDPDVIHGAIVFNTAPYAKMIEYGDSKGRQGRPIMTNSVFNNLPQIRTIITSYLKGVVK